MQEAWEDILLEMDSKLFNFAELKQVSMCMCVSEEWPKLVIFVV